METVALSKWTQSQLDQLGLPESPEFDLSNSIEGLAELPHTNAVRKALATASKLIRLQRKRIRSLENLALTDELTKLLNRRAFAKAFRRELALARRQTKGMGLLIMVDLDGFKKINDRLGHAAGDAYLKAVAEALIGSVRETDIVARLGGDEFALLLTSCAEGAGILRAEAIVANFHAKALSWKMESLPLKASFGLAAYQGDETAEFVLATADAALYSKKAMRRELIG